MKIQDYEGIAASSSLLTKYKCWNNNEWAEISPGYVARSNEGPYSVIFCKLDFYDEINDFSVRKHLKLRFLNETRLLPHKTNQGQT